MADTVKKSRIVSEECLSTFADSLTEDTSLQDIINEEFNQRLKNCMRNEPSYLEANADHIALTYELGEVVLKNGDLKQETIEQTTDVTTPSDLITESSVLNSPSKSKDCGLNGNSTTDPEHIENFAQNNGLTKQDTVIMNENFRPEEQPKERPVIEPLVGLEQPGVDHFVNKEVPTPEDEMEPPFDNITVTDVDSENLTAKERFLSAVTDLDDEDMASKVATAKDRMFLSTDSACILFTQTVVQSPMLTPTDESYDFLQGLRQNSSDTNITTPEDSSPVKNEEVVKKFCLTDSKTETRISQEDEHVEENREILTENGGNVGPSEICDKADTSSEISAENEVCNEIESSCSDVSEPHFKQVEEPLQVRLESSRGLELEESSTSADDTFSKPEESLHSEESSFRPEEACNPEDSFMKPTEVEPFQDQQISSGRVEIKEVTARFLEKEISECDGDMSKFQIQKPLKEPPQIIEDLVEDVEMDDEYLVKEAEEIVEKLDKETRERILSEEQNLLSEEQTVLSDEQNLVAEEQPQDLIEQELHSSPSKVSQISKMFSAEDREQNEPIKTPSPLPETFENIQKTKEIFERKSPEGDIPKSFELVKRLSDQSSEDVSEEFDTNNSVCNNGLSTTMTSESSFVETRIETNSSQDKVLKKKKSKKSKKDNEKENISVCDVTNNSDEDDLSHVSVKTLCRSFSDLTTIGSKNADAKVNSRVRYGRTKSMSDIRREDTNMDNVFSNVSVKSLRECFDNLTNRTNNCFEKKSPVNNSLLRTVVNKPSPRIEILVSLSSPHEKSSFSKFDALSKKTVLHVRSSDSGKAQEKFNGNAQIETSCCKSCTKQVFQMEQIKAEKAIWHKNCFRCKECNKQLNVDTYQSNEGVLYCKPHFKALFAPKVVEEDQPMRPRKHEMIIRENQPEELPPDVVRASDKPDLGLDELQNLNVKERFQVFEHHESQDNHVERTGAVNVKRSPSILSKLAKFQSKGMDIGVTDDSLNGVPVEESSTEEEEEEEEIEGEDADLIRAKRAQREKPLHFNNMSDMMSKWESGHQMTKEERREERKQEIQSIRNRLFMGKQGRMKELYQQAVAESESGMNVKKQVLDTELCEGAQSIKEKFERGETLTSDEQQKLHELEEDKGVFESGISKKSRSIFLELDANASKPPQMTPLSPSKSGTEVRRAREAFMNRQASEDVVRSTDQVDDVTIKTADISNRFKFFESYKEPEKQRKQFRFTPPRDGQVKMPSPERDVYRDPEVIRSEEHVDDSELAEKSHTATKMLSIFRQMEENMSKEPVPSGPKPLKRFTPPPEPVREDTDSGAEEESESDVDEEESDADERAKLVDGDLIEAQKAARAKQLRAKFEKWEANEIQREQNNCAVNIAEELADGESQIESARSLRQRFESMRSSNSEKALTPRVKVNRFV